MRPRECRGRGCEAQVGKGAAAHKIGRFGQVDRQDGSQC